MSPIGMILVFVISLGMFAFSAVRRWQLLQVGAPEPRAQTSTMDDILARVRQTFLYAFVQTKMPKNARYRLAGLAHIAIFAAFNVLLLNSVLLWIRGFYPEFDFWGLLGRESVVGMAYSLAKELSALGAILGCSVFVYYRIFKRPARMTLGFEGLLILFIIITMMIADYVYVGADIVRDATTASSVVTWHWAEPVGSALAMGFAGLEPGTVAVIEHLGFWWHAAWVLMFLNLLPHSKHFHVITVLPNIFFGPIDEMGKLPDLEDIEGKLEREEPLGVSKPEHLTWKHILDLYTCTECGRCSDNCPAFTTGKKLSPKHLTLAIRDHLYDLEPHYLGNDGIEAPDSAPKHRKTPEDWPEGYHHKAEVVDLVGDIIDPDVIWACTTCRACEEQCPVNISYVDKIVGMRRAEMMEKDAYPHELGKAFQNIEVNGNPWNLPAMDRGGWASELDFEVPMVSDRPDADVIYWVGCAANYDDPAKKVARAVARLLHHAEVDFAILGAEATCTGDPARRAGNEYLFQMLAEQNVETLNGYGAADKTVITACPHCFNTLANEYPSFGGKYDVVHHTEFLNGLVATGKLKPTKRVDATVAYHDSCYLGRYNGVYDSPREILSKIPGVKLEEVEYWNKEKGLCCGAGGAQMWKEEEPTRKGSETIRVNTKRTLQLLDTGADTVATGCPFCSTMISDGLKDEAASENPARAQAAEGVRQLDVAELLEQAIELGGVADAAE